MKTLEKQRQADYLLLHTIMGFYLKNGLDNVMIAPRYLEVESINEIVNPFYKLKRFIQRVEWLEDDENVDELVKYMTDNNLVFEELQWAIDMFAIRKKMVLDRIEKRI